MIDLRIGPIVNKPPYQARKVATLMLLLTIDQNVMLRIRRSVDRAGNVAQLDGKPQWSTSDADQTIVQLLPSDDGMSCFVETLGPAGTVQVNVTGDARLGEETRMIGGTLDIQVAPGEATILEIEADAPVAKE